MLARYLMDRDPASNKGATLVARIYRQSGWHRELADILEEMLESWGGTPRDYWNLGVAWLVSGESEKALNYFKHTSPYNQPLGRLIALHDLGRLEEFEAEFADMLADSDQFPEVVARVASWTGLHDIAFEYIDKTIEIEGPGIIRPMKEENDLYGPIMTDPRWQELLERHDFPEDVDTSHVRFNPMLPSEVVEALAAEKD